MTRTMRIELAAVLAVVLVLLAFSRFGQHEESSPVVEDQTASATDEPSRDATTNGSVESSGGDPIGSVGRPAPGDSRGRQGSSTAKGSRSTESLPEGTIARGFEIAFNSSGGLYLMNADGSDLRVLRAAGAQPGWSHDGKLIAFTDTWQGGDVQLINADGSGYQNLRARGSSPTWSPDGERLAFSWECDADGPECGIGVVSRDGSGVRRIGNGTSPDWGPDGRIIFTDGMCALQCALPIWVMNPDGTGRTRLPIDRAIAPTWSRDGRRIAYFTGTDGVFVANSDGTGIVKVAPAGYEDPSWSPDGVWLAVTRYATEQAGCGAAVPGTGSGCHSIYLRGIDGSAERRLTNSTNDGSPAFSPRR